MAGLFTLERRPGQDRGVRDTNMAVRDTNMLVRDVKQAVRDMRAGCSVRGR